MNLLPIGALNKIHIDEFDYNRLNKIHTILTRLYNGSYPLLEIMNGVNIVYF